MMRKGIFVDNDLDRNINMFIGEKSDVITDNVSVREASRSDLLCPAPLLQVKQQLT